MRVLHVIPVIAPRYGGPSQAIVGMCKALQHAGAEVLVATTDGDGPKRLQTVVGRPIPRAGVPTIFFRRQWSDSLHYSRPLASWLGTHVSEFDIVHIHAIFSHAGPAAAQACRRRRVPYVIRPLGHLDPWSLRQHRLRKQLMWHLGVKRMVDGAAAIHYTTPQEQRLAELSIGPTPGVVISLGVDDQLLGPWLPTAFPEEPVASLQRYPYLLALGRLHPKKRIDLLIDVFLDVIDGGVGGDWRLAVVGDGDPDYVTQLKRQAAARRSGERVVFTGWLGGHQRTAVLRGASLTALPSRQENFGLVVIESLACGVPVLISPEVNLADEIRAAEAGWVAALDRTTLSSTLAEVLRSPAERQRRGALGRSLACTRYTWPRVAEQLTALYAALMLKSTRVPG